MAEVITFSSRAELDAKQNMESFKKLCKSELKVFGAELPFDEDVWDISDFIQLKGMRTAQRLIFSNLQTCNSSIQTMLEEPFKSFAKSYIRYQFGLKPTVAVGRKLLSLRALETALLESGVADPARTDSHILNRAAQLISERFAINSAYQIANDLANIAGFLRDNRLASISTRWRHPIRRPDEISRVGAEFDKRRAEKLPSQAALDALPIVFRQAKHPADVIVSSIAAILSSAPDRINEILLLPELCEVQVKHDSASSDAYGLRWHTSKGASPMVKWIIPSMVEVVKIALKRIRGITEEARQVSRWYENNPEKIYLTREEEHLRNQEWITMHELARILFVDAMPSESAKFWCIRKKIPLRRERRELLTRFVDVEREVLRMLPRGFPSVHPSTSLKYGDMLCVIQRNLLDTVKPQFRCVVEPIVHLHVHNRLGARAETGIRSIFDRYEFYEKDGSPIRVKSHQFRHYLNTLAQTGGLSQIDIAKWSGRSDVRQNRYYDHETSRAVVERIRTTIGDEPRMFGPSGEKRPVFLIRRDKFSRLRIPTAHTTDFGYCVHDYVMAPCQIHRDCLNCEEQVCIKGEVEKEQRIRQAYNEVRTLIAMAEKAEADGEFGAHEWVVHHKVKRDRISALIDILDNSSVPDGSVIRVAPVDDLMHLKSNSPARALHHHKGQYPTKTDETTGEENGPVEREKSK